jgi:DNA mismatch repair protein MutS
VVERARDLLLFLEQHAQGARAGEEGTPLARQTGQSSLFGWMLPERAAAAEGTEGDDETSPPEPKGPRLEATEAAALARLAEVDPDALSPREAMDLIYELHGILRGQHEWLEE